MHFAVNCRLVEIEFKTTHLLILQQELGGVSTKKVRISLVVLSEINSLTIVLESIILQNTEVLRPGRSDECKSFDIPQVHIVDDCTIVVAQLRIGYTKSHPVHILKLK